MLCLEYNKPYIIFYNILKMEMAFIEIKLKFKYMFNGKGRGNNVRKGCFFNVGRSKKVRR